MVSMNARRSPRKRASASVGRVQVRPRGPTAGEAPEQLARGTIPWPYTSIVWPQSAAICQPHRLSRWRSRSRPRRMGTTPPERRRKSVSWCLASRRAPRRSRRSASPRRSEDSTRQGRSRYRKLQDLALAQRCIAGSQQRQSGPHEGTRRGSVAPVGGERRRGRPDPSGSSCGNPTGKRTRQPSW